jgi:DNA-binding transcriptional regulator YdaS (Cro superfamily)
MERNSIEQAAFYAGGQSALARELGITHQAVQAWCHKNRIPAEWVIQVEQIVKGKITRHELRPDLYPIEKPSKLGARK